MTGSGIAAPGKYLIALFPHHGSVDVVLWMQLDASRQQPAATTDLGLAARFDLAIAQEVVDQDRWGALPVAVPAKLAERAVLRRSIDAAADENRCWFGSGPQRLRAELARHLGALPAPADSKYLVASFLHQSPHHRHLPHTQAFTDERHLVQWWVRPGLATTVSDIGLAGRLTPAECAAYVQREHAVAVPERALDSPEIRVQRTVHASDNPAFRDALSLAALPGVYAASSSSAFAAACRADGNDSDDADLHQDRPHG